MSLCASSSTPLTNLQKHLSSTSPPPSSSFTNGANTSHLRAPAFRNARAPADAEFAAFEAGVQRLHVSAPAQQWQAWEGGGGVGGMGGQGVGGWHEEFMMMANTSARSQPPASSSFAGTGLSSSSSSWGGLGGGVGGVGGEREWGEGRMGMRGKMPMMMHQAQSPYFPSFPHTLPQTSTTLPAQQLQPQAQATADIDDAAFEAAFAAAAATLSSTSSPSSLPAPTEEKQQEQETVKQEEEEKEEEYNQTDDIAKTAGNLLDSLSSESSKKFRESEFMALMRRLRDGEVRVVGDRMVEVGVST